MRRFDAHIQIDGEHTVWVREGRIEIISAADVYTWRRSEPAAAWPLHEERGVLSGARIREHETPPALPRETVARSHWIPADFESAVATQLNRVFQTRSGASLHNVIGMDLTIMPFPIRDPVTLEGRYRPNAAPRARSSDRSLYIIYTPGHFPSRFRASSLFHELVHVYRIMAGVYRPREDARYPARYTTWEEFPAVCIENVFRSEVALPLRWGHYDLSMELENPDAWIENADNRRAVEQLIREMPVLTRSLADIDVPFNPFRQISRRHASIAPRSRAAFHVPGVVGRG
jgi:hypothetical protein